MLTSQTQVGCQSTKVWAQRVHKFSPMCQAQFAFAIFLGVCNGAKPWFRRRKWDVVNALVLKMHWFFVMFHVFSGFP